MATSSLRDAFLADGFAHVPNALDQRTLEVALACWTWSTGHPGPGATRLYRDAMASVVDLDAARRLPSDESGFFYQDIGSRDSRQVYEPLVRSAAVTSLLRRVLDGERAWFLGEQVFLKEGDTPATGWHQDISDITARGDDMIVLWITFDPVDEETALGLVTGSHRGPVYSSIYGRYRADPIPNVDARPDEFEVAAYPCEPGDVVIFHMGCLHGRGATKPRQRRRTLALRFIGENCLFDSRTNPSDPRNGDPYRRDHLLQVLPQGP